MHDAPFDSQCRRRSADRAPEFCVLRRGKGLPPLAPVPFRVASKYGKPQADLAGPNVEAQIVEERRVRHTATDIAEFSVR
jgi:hypothetical protein